MPKATRVEGTEDIYERHPHGTYALRHYTSEHGEKWESLKTKNLREAKLRAKEARARFARETIRDRRLSNYGEIAEECFLVRQKKNRDRTVREAAYIYEERLIPAFGKLHIDAVTDALWLEQLEDWKRSTDRKTFANVRKYALQIDRYAHAKGYKSFRCEFPIDDPKPREGVVLSDSQLATTLDGCLNWYREGIRIRPRVKTDLARGKRTRVFILMGAYHGMRRKEITALTRSHIDLGKRSITLRPEDVKTGSKTGRGRTLAIAPEVYPALVELLEETRGVWLFPNRRGDGPVDTKSINRVVKRLCRQTKIDFRPHDLRHRFLHTKLCVEKKDPFSVCVYAGLSLAVAERRYVHPTVDDTRHVVELPKPDSQTDSGDREMRYGND